MKGIPAFLAIVIIGILLFQASLIQKLQTEVEALHEMQSLAHTDPTMTSLREARHKYGATDNIIDTQIDLEAVSNAFTESFSKMLVDQQELLAEQQLNALNEYFQSEAFEARLWDITSRLS